MKYIRLLAAQLFLLTGALSHVAFAQPAILGGAINGVASPGTIPVSPGAATNLAATIQDTGTGVTYVFFDLEVWPSSQYSCKVGVQILSPANQSNIFLHSDSGAPLSNMTVGAAQTQANSKCSLSAASSFVTTSGNLFTVSVNLTFNDPYNGIKYLYVDAYDQVGTPSNWYAPPNCSIVIQSADYAPQTLSVTPSGGGSHSTGQQTFQVTLTDPNGAFTVWHLELILAPQGAGWSPGYNFQPQQRCKVVAESSANLIWIEGDSQNAQVAPGLVPFGSSQPASIADNGRCSLIPKFTSQTYLDITTQVITFTVQFQAPFAGPLQTHTFIADNLGQQVWDSQANGIWKWNVRADNYQVFAVPASSRVTGGSNLAFYSIVGGSRATWISDFGVAVPGSLGSCDAVPNNFPFGSRSYVFIASNMSPNWCMISALQLMYQQGQRRLRLPVFFSHDSQATQAGVDPNTGFRSYCSLSGMNNNTIASNGGIFPPLCTENLANLLATIKTIGFSAIEVGFFPSAYNDPYNSQFYNAAYDSEWFPIIQTIRDTLIKSGVPYTIDLFNEGAPPNSPIYSNVSRVSRSLYSRYATTYGLSDTVGISIVAGASPSGQTTGVINALFSNILAGYGSPPIFDVHIYDGVGGVLPVFQALSEVVSALRSHGIQNPKLIVGEANYNDATEASALNGADASFGYPIVWLTQWPLDRNNVTVPLPLFFNNYLSYNF